MSAAEAGVPSVKAVLFDMDGTLIDSEASYRNAFRQRLASAGVPWAPHLDEELKGLATPLLADMLIRLGVDGITRQDLADQIDAAVESDIRRNGVPWKPGARELVDSVVASPLSTGLVTMSCRPIVDLVLPEVASPGFDVVVTAESVLAAKPAPDGYLLAARQLGVEPGSCVAVEDSAPGFTSARSAGMWVIGAHLDRPLSPNLVNEVWPSLLGRTPGDFISR